jgi:PadR family transcriptional regulator, regulatory protein AphA
MTAASRVVLGMLRLGRRTGYEIKQLVDVSTRFFWAASYGQIYPELKRLEDDGLIEGGEAATDGRRRREYRLTAEGERVLDEWLRSSEAPVLETRDEGLLKLFFSDGMRPEEKLELVRGMRARHDEVVASLRSIELGAREKGGGPYEVLRFGLAFHGFCSEWLKNMESELEAEPAARR